jgi:alpha-L-rhamnosidase
MMIHRVLAFALCASLLTQARAASPASEIGPVEKPFVKAKPVWPEGREKEKNLFVGFHAAFEAPGREPVVLRMTGSTLYRITLNGEFVGHGPARGPHGFYRQDEWPLAVKPGVNHLAIEVAGYNANSYYLLDQPSFLQAEIATRDKVLASTGAANDGFQAAVLDYRVQKVQRFSFQRPFIEVYTLNPQSESWKNGADFKPATCALQPDKPILARGVPYPQFELKPAVWSVGAGRVEPVSTKDFWKDRSLVNIGPQLGGFPEAELALVPTQDWQKLKSTVTNKTHSPADNDHAWAIANNEFRILDFGGNLSGFPRATVVCKEKGRLSVTFDEILRGGDVDWKRLGCASIVTYDLEPGEYHLESFEPYTMRYVKFTSLGGQFEIRGVSLRELANPETRKAQFACSDPDLNQLFDAARETYRQNAPDIFTDCPSRERAGWLCDSFWTGRVAFDFSGNTATERAFFQNFALPDKFQFLPEGMLPMCYPADHNDGVYIPNWALWFVVELDEYAARGGDPALIEALRPRVFKLMEWFSHYRNADGLLEKLPSWVFVEWSKANDLVQDVNYPSSMLYAGALDAAGRLYGNEDFKRQAAAIRETIRKQSFDGEFFVDNAIRENGVLKVTRNRTEVCQYYAFFFGIATPETHPKLHETLIKGFGPGRQAAHGYPEIHPANAFIGNYLRFELLSRSGRTAQILSESKGYFQKMANLTGTLWEMDQTVASCNHGFASHVAHFLIRDVLGIYSVDPVRKVVHLRFSDAPLDWCSATLPLGNGFISVKWHRQGGRIEYQADVPAGYTVAVDPVAGVETVRK